MAICEFFLRVCIARVIPEDSAAAFEKQLHMEGSPRRAAFYGQLRTEVFAACGLDRRELETLEALEDTYLVDLP
jgi:hypothetical protein